MSFGVRLAEGDTGVRDSLKGGKWREMREWGKGKKMREIDKRWKTNGEA